MPLIKGGQNLNVDTTLVNRTPAELLLNTPTPLSTSTEIAMNVYELRKQQGFQLS